MYTVRAAGIVVSIARWPRWVSAALGTLPLQAVLANSEFATNSGKRRTVQGPVGAVLITVGAGIDFGVLLAKPVRIIEAEFRGDGDQGLLCTAFLARVFASKAAHAGCSPQLRAGRRIRLCSTAFRCNKTRLSGRWALDSIRPSMMITLLLFIRLCDAMSRRMHVEEAVQPERRHRRKGTVIIAG
jgi:CPA2 family monovalent cation:H+ antiporter-2